MSKSHQQLSKEKVFESLNQSEGKHTFFSFVVLFELLRLTDCHHHICALNGHG